MNQMQGLVFVFGAVMVTLLVREQFKQFIRSECYEAINDAEENKKRFETWKGDSNGKVSDDGSND